MAVDAAITRIADNPLAYPERYRGVRRALLRRFAYVLWYRPSMGHTRYTLLTLVKGLAALAALETVDEGLTLTGLARRLEESWTVGA